METTYIDNWSFGGSGGLSKIIETVQLCLSHLNTEPYIEYILIDL